MGYYLPWNCKLIRSAKFACPWRSSCLLIGPNLNVYLRRYVSAICQWHGDVGVTPRLPPTSLAPEVWYAPGGICGLRLSLVQFWLCLRRLVLFACFFVSIFCLFLFFCFFTCAFCFVLFCFSAGSPIYIGTLHKSQLTVRNFNLIRTLWSHGLSCHS